MKELIIDAAARHGVPAEMLGGIVETESAGEPLAMRFEPGYRWLVPTTVHGGSQATEINGQRTSWGLGQIMGAVARERGFAGRWLSELLDPETNLEFVARHLAYLFKRYDVGTDVIAAYNQGNNRKGEGGQYSNQSYVDKVLVAMNRFEETHELKERIS